MKHFITFSEERQLEIVREHEQFFVEKTLETNEEHITNQIRESLKKFCEKWRLAKVHVDFQFTKENQLSYEMESFRWRRKDIFEIASLPEFAWRKVEVTEAVEWFEQVGGMEFFINVSLRANAFELSTSHRFVLTRVLTVDEKRFRLQLLKQEFEDDEDVLKELEEIERVPATSKLKKVVEERLDEIVKESFYKKRKSWSRRMYEELEKDFEKLKQENQRIVDFYKSEAYLVDQLKKDNLVWFKENGDPVKE